MRTDVQQPEDVEAMREKLAGSQTELPLEAPSSVHSVVMLYATQENNQNGGIQPEPAPRSQAAQEIQETILVVEDDPLLLEFVSELLGSLGYHLLLAQDTDAAMQFVEDRQNVIDLIFSDIRLPGGMNGIALAKKAKSMRENVKVILTTGYSSDVVHEEFGGESFFVLQKPYFPNDLSQTIRTVLDQS